MLPWPGGCSPSGPERKGKEHGSEGNAADFMNRRGERKLVQIGGVFVFPTPKYTFLKKPMF